MNFPTKYIQDLKDFKDYVSDLVDYIKQFEEETKSEYQQYYNGLEYDIEEYELDITVLKQENKELLKKLEEYETKLEKGE